MERVHNDGTGPNLMRWRTVDGRVLEARRDDAPDFHWLWTTNGRHLGRIVSFDHPKGAWCSLTDGEWEPLGVETMEEAVLKLNA